MTIPDTIKVKGYDIPVTAIADKAFSKDKNLTTVTIGKNVITIGKNAFNSCAKLKTVKGGAAVEVIKDSAFSGCAKLKNPWKKALDQNGNVYEDEILSIPLGEGTSVRLTQAD